MLTGHVMHEAAFLFLAHLHKTKFCFCFFFFAFRLFYVSLSLRCVALGFRFLLSLSFFISSSFCCQLYSSFSWKYGCYGEILSGSILKG